MMLSTEPPSAELSAAEIAEIFRALPDAAWLRLKKIAQIRSAAGALSADDLLQEALTRALEGSRKCPRNVGVFRFLDGVMQSISSDDVKARMRRPEQTFSSMGDDEAAFDAPDGGPSAEQKIVDEQAVSAIKKAMIDLFADDPVAQTIVEGDMEDMKGEELRALTELDPKAFASKRRFIRRQIERAYPRGWNA